jgi:hypothetical protein
LRDYCLSHDHPRGRHKARVFRSALNMTEDDAEELRDALLSAARTHDAAIAEGDEYGQRYVLDFEVSREGVRAGIRSSWIVRRGEDFPRLTSCHVL